jgi:squalene-hopene/tetraprenyl-beta-curcumene cyclase
MNRLKSLVHVEQVPVAGNLLLHRVQMRELIPYVLPASVQANFDMLQQESAAEQQALFAKAQVCSTKATQALLRCQKSDGSWCGDLTGDSTLLSDYILLQLWLQPAANGKPWQPGNTQRIQRVVRSLWKAELPTGGWNQFPDGPIEVNATVRAYTALKIAGEDSTTFRMKRIRNLILEMGGLQACNSYTKINLSFFDLFPRRFVPTVPPELLIVPGNVLYEMSSWTRTIVVPLAIVQALGETRPTPNGMRIDELFHPHKRLSLPRKDRISEVFIQADRLFKLWEQKGSRKIRTKAIRAAERWTLEHMQHSEGLGAIYPAMMYAIMALDALGYDRDQPDLARAINQMEDLLIEQGDTVNFQPAKSPVWDTAITAFALGEKGAVDQQITTKAADWLLQKEVRRKGDWSEKRPDLKPSGWAFEYDNDFYPDIDDTAMVLLALLHAKASDPERQKAVEHRAVQWLLGMQSSDGGWAAFDVDNNWRILNNVPFADHNAMLDPTCADITGRVMESLCRRGMSERDPEIQRGIQYLLINQESNGSWYGRWGVNYIYGTFLAMRGLHATASPHAYRAVRKGAAWLCAVQNDDGGWGESCLGYAKGKFVRAASTPTQTAWALLGLSVTDGMQTSAVRRGIQWLVDHQRQDGTWEENLATGTGFPNVFYLSYHMYRNYFPLFALSQFGKTRPEHGRVSVT